MRVLFAGPSFGTEIEQVKLQDPGLRVLPPAAWGDIARAVGEGATTIGLVDGFFESTRTVWHKEILHAMSQGVRIAGASSMGALRAFECHPFGMLGIGKIFTMYQSGKLTDDSDVALIHGPAEMDYMALSEPRVNVLLTLESMHVCKRISLEELRSLTAVARRIFYAELNMQSVLNHLPGADRRRIAQLVAWAQTHKIDQKRADALQLASWLREPDKREYQPTNWDFSNSSQWSAMQKEIRARSGGKATSSSLSNGPPGPIGRR